MTTSLPVWLGLAAILLYGLVRLGRRPRRATRRAAIRRGTGHALLGLQGFIEPGVEHVLGTENREHRDVEDDQGAGDADSPERIRADLAESLGRTPLDADEIRSHLAAARRAGMDWRSAYDEAVRAELAARPYRAPSLPPPGRVAPRASDPS